jgi:hypothetical protein
MTTTINQKLLEFQTSIETIKKDGKNTFFKKPDGKPSTYATLDNILSEVKPLLNALKIVVKQPILNGEVFTILFDTDSGDEVCSSIPLTAGLNPQQRGSEITYFRRYTIAALLSLEIGDDDDGNNATAPTPQPNEKPWLTDKQFEAMKDTIAKGDKDSVKKAMGNYRMKKEFTTELTSLLK